jgi:uncharacterized repeat protein (TIGR01451 family)
VTNGGDAVEGDTVTLRAGDTATCTITNTFTPFSSDVSLTKTVDDSTPDAGQTITYTLTVSNAGPDDATDVVVTDQLPEGITYVSDSGEGAYATSTGEWAVGTLAANGSATLTITATVSSGTGGMSISNNASVSDANADPDADNNAVSASLTVNTPTPAPTPTPNNTGGGGGGGRIGGSILPHGQVLGAATSSPALGVTCGVFLNQHLKMGSPKNNADQVTKLQQFLVKHGYGTFAPTGYFGPLTFAAVKAFQQAYADAILVPWNIQAPTGLVYLTTTRQVDLIECPDLMLPMPELVPWNQNPNAQ